MIDVGFVGQGYISKDAFVLVVAVGLDRDLFPEGEVRGNLLRSLAVGLALLRAVDPAEADTIRVLVVQDFEGVAVEDRDDEAREVGERGIGKKKEEETCQK